MIILAIDPGAKGAIACWNGGDVAVYKMPETQSDMADFFGQNNFYGNPEAIIENVGGYMPGNSGPAAVKFARQVERCQMALTCAQIPWNLVAPTTWMKGVLNTVPKDKKQRKNAIKAAMQRTYPHLKVTLDNADALGILTWYLGRKA